MERAKAWAAPIIALLVALALAFCWNLSHRARVAAERDAEQSRLLLSGQIVASDASDKDLRANIEKLLLDNDLLRQAYESAKAAAPGAHPVAAADLSTGRVRVTGPLPPTPQPAPAPVEVTSGNDLTEKICALRDQDEVSIEAKVLTLATQERNWLLAGVASLYREPEHRQLATGKFTANLSAVEAEAPRPEPRWGVALAGLCQPSGCAPGVGVLLPPWRVLGARLEGSAALYGGVSGLSLTGQVGVRW